jgi:uncharacterized membrane protein
MSDCRQRPRRETSSIILGWAFVLPAFGLTGATEYASAVEQSADTTTTIESASAAPLAFDALKSMMNQFCYKCHGGGTTEADVDLTAYTRRETLLANIDATREIRDAVARHEMPPEATPLQPLHHHHQSSQPIRKIPFVSLRSTLPLRRRFVLPDVG